MSNPRSRPRTYRVYTQYCERGHDTHVVGTDYNGYCNTCQSKRSPSHVRQTERAEKLLKLTNQLEHCMSWERKEILSRIRVLMKGSTD